MCDIFFLFAKASKVTVGTRVLLDLDPLFPVIWLTSDSDSQVNSITPTLFATADTTKVILFSNLFRSTFWLNFEISIGVGSKAYTLPVLIWDAAKSDIAPMFAPTSKKVHFFFTTDWIKLLS